MRIIHPQFFFLVSISYLRSLCCHRLILDISSKRSHVSSMLIYYCFEFSWCSALESQFTALRDHRVDFSDSLRCAKCCSQFILHVYLTSVRKIICRKLQLYFLYRPGMKTECWLKMGENELLSGKEIGTFLCPKCISLVSIPRFSFSRCDTITHFLLPFFYTNSSLLNSHFIFKRS